MPTDYKKLLEACPLLEKIDLARRNLHNAWEIRVWKNGKRELDIQHIDQTHEQFKEAVRHASDAALDAQPELRAEYDEQRPRSDRLFKEWAQMADAGRGGPELIEKNRAAWEAAERAGDAREQAVKNLEDYCSKPTS